MSRVQKEDRINNEFFVSAKKSDRPRSLADYCPQLKIGCIRMDVKILIEVWILE
jgi:hypothetical protein